MFYSIPYSVIIPAFLLLGALIVLCIYNTILYYNHKEKIIIKYSFYLISILLYVLIDLYHQSSITKFSLDLAYFSRGINYIVILSYAYFLYEVVVSVKAKQPLLFLVWDVLVKVTLVYIIFCFAISFFPSSVLKKWNILIAEILRFAYLIQGIWAVVVLFPIVKGKFVNIIKWGGGVYLLFMILVQISVFRPNQMLWKLHYLHWFYIGTFIEIIIFSFAISYKVKEAFLAVIEVRTNLARDLHDEIGSSLSSLQIYGAIANQTIVTDPNKATEMVEKMSRQSLQIMENMNDIVWSMNTSRDSITSLETKIKNYAAELLHDKHIELAVVIDELAEKSLLNINARKNILLIIKEVLNNAAKYSGANKVEVKVVVRNNFWHLYISDNGIGLNQSKMNNGNGLGNIKSRTKDLDGEVEINTKGGVTFQFKFPLVMLLQK